MNRKMIYLLSLLSFFIMWGLFGFAAAGPRSEPNFQATVPPVENTPVLPGGTEAAGIPVTAESEPLWIEILGFYGLAGLAALSLIWAMLSSANKATALYPKHKEPPSEETHKN